MSFVSSLFLCPTYSSGRELSAFVRLGGLAHGPAEQESGSVGTNLPNKRFKKADNKKESLCVYLLR